MTNKIITILFLIWVSETSPAFARDDSAFDRTGTRSGDSYAQRGGMRTSVTAQESQRAVAPSTSRASTSTDRPSGGSGFERESGAGRNVSAPVRDAPRTTYTPATSAQVVRQPNVVVTPPSRETARTSHTPAQATQTVRQPSVVVAAPSRETAHTSYAPAQDTQSVRQPSVPRDVPNRAATRAAPADSVRPAQSRTAESTRSITASREESARTTETAHTLSALAKPRAISAPRTSEDQRSVISAPGAYRHPQAPSVSAVSARPRTEAVTTPHRTDAASTTLVHEPLDGRSNSFRTISTPNLHENPTRLPFSGHSNVGDRHSSDNRANHSPAFVSTALHQTNPYEPPHHNYTDRHYSAYRHHDAYRPLWFAPVVYPVGFSMTWGSRSAFPLTVSSYGPACAYSDSYMPYYDSWSYGRQGCSSVYYGGWRHGWYGGFSYVYNPWPVYSTCYFYDPPQVVTQSETVYVSQPVSTATAVPVPEAVVSAPVPEADAPTASPPPLPAGEALPVSVSSATVTNMQTVALNEATANATAAGEIPSGFEYATTSEDFALDFASYSETLNAERIWSSYAGLDRSDPSAKIRLDDETAANSPR